MKSERFICTPRVFYDLFYDFAFFGHEESTLPEMTTLILAQ